MTKHIYSQLVSYDWEHKNFRYLNRYINFINNIQSKRPENKKLPDMERHHIIPKSMGRHK